MDTVTEHRPAARTGDHSMGDLVKQATEQFSDLVRQEMRLAQVEMAQKGRRFGLGGGLFGGAGAVGYLALMAFVVAAITGIAAALPVWGAALIVAGALALSAAVLATVGKRQVSRAVPPSPQQAINSVKADVQEIRERAHR